LKTIIGANVFQVIIVFELLLGFDNERIPFARFLFIGGGEGFSPSGTPGAVGRLEAIGKRIWWMMERKGAWLIDKIAFRRLSSLQQKDNKAQRK
jgi:hypothetical protein